MGGSAMTTQGQVTDDSVERAPVAPAQASSVLPVVQGETGWAVGSVYGWRPGRVFELLPWRRSAIWLPLLDAVRAARELFTHDVDHVPTSRVGRNSRAMEPPNMPVAKAPSNMLLPEAEPPPPALASMQASARL